MMEESKQLGASDDPFFPWGSGVKVWCMHCNGSFQSEDVIERFEDGMCLHFCPHPGCDGSSIDFSSIPWWDHNRVSSEEYQAHMFRCATGEDR